MGDRVAKDALYAEFAAVGKVLGSPKRLELLDLLAQGPRSVEELAAAADLGMSTCSAHLQTLREAGLVAHPAGGQACLLLPRRRRRRRPVGPPAPGRPATPPAHRPRPPRLPRPRRHRAPSDTDELLRRLAPATPWSSTCAPPPSTPPATSPARCTSRWKSSRTGSPSCRADLEIVAYCRGQYCVLAHDAVRLLTGHGLQARRAAEGMLEWRVAGLPVEVGAA